MKKFLSLFIFSFCAAAFGQRQINPSAFGTKLIRSENRDAVRARIGVPVRHLAPIIATNISRTASYEEFPVTETAPNGKIFTIMRRARADVQTNSDLALFVSLDGGASQQFVSVISTNANIDSRNHAFGISDDGRLICIHARYDLIANKWTNPIVRISDNDGLTWRTSQTIATNGFANLPFSSTALISPYGHIREKGGILYAGCYSANSSATANYVLKSYDDGLTWTNTRISSADNTGWAEPEVLPLDNGFVFVAARTQLTGTWAGQIPTYWSSNSGTNWSGVTFVETGTTNSIGYPSGLCSFQADDGEQIGMAYGNRDDQKIYWSSAPVSQVYTNPGILFDNRVALPVEIAKSTDTSNGGYPSPDSVDGSGDILMSYYQYLGTNASIQFARASKIQAAETDVSVTNDISANQLTGTVTIPVQTDNGIFTFGSDSAGNNTDDDLQAWAVKSVDGDYLARMFFVGSEYELLLNDGTANAISRVAYSRKSSLVIAADDTTIVSGPQFVMSGTNTLFGVAMGFSVRWGSGGKFLFKDSSGATAMTLDDTNVTVGSSKTLVFSKAMAGGNAGLTTNINVIVAGSLTNQLQFTAGLLTGVVPQ